MVAVTTFERHELEEFVRAWDTAFHLGEYETIAAVYDDTAVVATTNRGIDITVVLNWFDELRHDVPIR